MSVQLQAKFRCMQINHGVSHHPTECAVTIVMQPVWIDGDETNKGWSRATPSGKLELFVTNPAFVEHFAPGEDFILEFKPVTKAGVGAA